MVETKTELNHKIILHLHIHQVARNRTPNVIQSCSVCWMCYLAAVYEHVHQCKSFSWRLSMICFDTVRTMIVLCLTRDQLLHWSCIQRTCEQNQLLGMWQPLQSTNMSALCRVKYAPKTLQMHYVIILPSLQQFPFQLPQICYCINLPCIRCVLGSLSVEVHIL